MDRDQSRAAMLATLATVPRALRPPAEAPAPRRHPAVIRDATALPNVNIPPGASDEAAFVALLTFWRNRCNRDRLTIIEQDEALDAYVSAGAWVADCVCRSGVSVFPGAAHAICIACGRAWEIRFPDEADREAIAFSFDGVPEAHRNWRAD